MREHEVPTHVQAEDRVLLGFTFPQVVAITAVCALSYGAYRYAPVGPSEVRMALAVLFGLVGVAMVVGKIGGRRLPLVAADLLKYRLGARRYTGQTAQLVRSELPAPAQPVKTGPGPIRLMVRKARRGLRRQRKKTRQSKERRNGVKTISAYAKDMRDFLNESELTERRAFIESFVKEIIVMPGDALMRYPVPMPDDSLIPGRATEKVALNGSVLSTVHDGGPTWTVDGTIFEMWLGSLRYPSPSLLQQ